MNIKLDSGTALEALKWIINFLETNDIPYLVCGGLAAIAYGSRRPLYDIDIYVSDSSYQTIIEFGTDYISYGPERYCDDRWKVDYVQFIYSGQKIEVGSSKDIQIFDVKNKIWHKESLDFSAYERIVISGQIIRVMDKQSLIAYKKKLNRDVDIIDIEQIEDAH